MTSKNTSIGRSALLITALTTAALSALAVPVATAAAAAAATPLPSDDRYTTEEALCTIDPHSGEEECEAVYFEPEIDAMERHDDDDDDDDDHSDEDQDYNPKCHDDDEKCSEYASPDGKNGCVTNPGYMNYHCPVSCDACDVYEKAHDANEGGAGVCSDGDFKCDEWASSGECDYNPNYMKTVCRRACFVCVEDSNQYGVHQTPPSENDPLYDATVQSIANSTTYMKTVWTDPESKRVRHKCRNMEKLCSYWAQLGECDANPDYMTVNCAPACQTCHKLDTRLRCPVDEETNACLWKPGDLNELFENMVDDADGSGVYRKYNPQAISRPKTKRDGTAAPNVEKDGPWIVTLEHFLSDEEADALVEAGGLVGYERSSDVGKELPDGSHEGDVNEGRTSHNAWCEDEACSQNATILPVIERIANVTGTSVGNSEFLQLLRYEPGQFYQQHHDYIEYQADMPCGARILTLFLYLNDVEEGGGTRFSDLDLTVQPKKGNAVLWPSVLDGSPEAKDGRTDHEALPVISGIKYGANAWIHSRNFKEAYEVGCV